MADLKSTTIEDNYPDENAPRHRCCCNNVHPIVGAQTMATLGIIFCSIAFSLLVYNLIGSNADDNKPLTITCVVLVIIEIVATFLVFCATQKRREAFLIPILVIKCLNIVLVFATVVLGAVVIGQSTYVEEREYITFIFKSISRAAFWIWSFIVYFHCYQFLKAKNQWIRSNHLALRDSQVQPDSLKDSPPPVYAEVV